MALPGVKTTILDRFYGMQRTDLPGGPIVALIAKRNTANSSATPDLEPYLATGEQDVITAYGENSNIHRAYVEASTAGAARIVLVPLPSDTVFTNSTGTVTSASAGGNIFDLIFDAVEAVRADIIVPWGAGSDSTVWDDQATPATPGGTLDDFFYADNSNVLGNSWAAKVAAKCSQITANSYPCFAVMGVKGFTGLENTSTAQTNTGLNALIANTKLVNKESVTVGHFVTVVATEVHPISYPDAWGWANGAATFAALAARLDVQRALTGKPVYNVDKVRWQPSRTQSDSLGGKGVVTAGTDWSGALKWVDAMTFAPANSDYIRLTTLRVSFDTVKIVLSVAQNYIGEAMSLSAKNAFETQISSKLQAMTRLGAINNSNFRVRYEAVENRAYVDLAIEPAFELREIILTVSINF